MWLQNLEPLVVLCNVHGQHSLTIQRKLCQFAQYNENAPCAICKHLRGGLDAGGIWQRQHGSLLGLLHTRLLQVDAVHAL